MADFIFIHSGHSITLMKFIAFVLITFVCLSCGPSRPDKNILALDTVSIETGKITGIRNDSSGVWAFKGIPFAAPPLGDLRWKEPQPAAPWEGVRACTTFSASAMQNPPNPFMMWSKEFMAPLEPLSEDCLYLNVWTAAASADEKRPVIVWIHGGGFTGGSGSVPLYDGEGLAKKGVVFVTINYRLGIFGFLAHPELTKESPHQASGNYALLDQLAALRWVKKNIAVFGGDPGRVTIAGQSAGSFCVNALMASPLGKGLFERAIGQSGGMFSRETRLMPLADAEKAGLAVAEKMKVKSLAELRAIPAADLLNAASTNVVTLDGYFLPRSVLEIFEAGEQNDVPLLTGWNSDEGFAFGKPKTAQEFKADAEKKYGSMAADFLKVYPAANDEQAASTQKIISRNEIFAWQNYTWARKQSRAKSKAFLYQFSRVPPGEPNYGAFHSAEFGYCLATLYNWDRPFEAWDHTLSDAMSSYWVNFAANGDPNGEGLTVWPPLDLSNLQLIDFGNEIKVGGIPSKDQFDFMDAYQATLATGK